MVEMSREMIVFFVLAIFMVLFIIFAAGMATGIVPSSMFHGDNLIDSAFNGIKGLIGV
ncbi:MAG: hypothetical protein KJ697_04220 [Nanoarchaeota archaeon]|nr:hypothetical protein [Nanoarchaeota archaeon]